MNQGTTLINAEEIFGSFSELGNFQDSKDGFEEYWEWPEEIGNGFISMIKLRPGLMLGVGNYRLIENIAISFKFKYSSVVLGFSVSGNVSHTVNYGEGQKHFRHFKHGHSVISYLPECQGVAKYPARTPVRSVGIYVDPLLLNTFMEGQYDQIPIGMRSIVNGADEKPYYQASTTTRSVNVVIHQILNCPYQFPFKRLYFESKTLELLTHAMAQLVVSKDGHSKTMALQPNDIERVRDAKNILLRNLEKPPSLLELARQVGTNKDKLNQDFRQVFGASVFEYLRTSRLERARLLLESKEKNVTEAAFEVGYAHPKNFARAFKNHFGTNPKDHLH